MSARASHSHASPDAHWYFRSYDDHEPQGFFAGEPICAPRVRRGSTMLPAAIAIVILFSGGFAALETKAIWEQWLPTDFAAISSLLAPSAQGLANHKATVDESPPRATRVARDHRGSRRRGRYAAAIAGGEHSACDDTERDGAGCNSRGRNGFRRRAKRALAAAHRRCLGRLSDAGVGRWPASGPVASVADADVGRRLSQRGRRDQNCPGRDTRRRRPRLAARAQAERRALRGAVREERRTRLPPLRRDRHQGSLVDYRTADGEVRLERAGAEFLRTKQASQCLRRLS